MASLVLRRKKRKSIVSRENSRQIETEDLTMLTETANQSLKEDDWIVVRFKLLEQSGELRWVGKILRVNDNKTFLVTFLRPKHTTLHTGFIYTYPPRDPDEDTVCRTQILYIVPPFKKFQRYLHF